VYNMRLDSASFLKRYLISCPFDAAYHDHSSGTTVIHFDIGQFIPFGKVCMSGMTCIVSFISSLNAPLSLQSNIAVLQ